MRLTPLFDLTNAITASPTSICQEDTVLLTGTSNHNIVSWKWSPATSLTAPLSRITKGFPLISTSYSLETRWGRNCVVSDTINIPVKALAIPDAGPAGYICSGQTVTSLSASGGDTYTWTPVTGLSNPNIANPVASPGSTTLYTVHVGVNGCSRKKDDTVRIEVKARPYLRVTNDTIICIVDGLQLNATGGGTVIWTPNYNINNTSILTPFVTPAISTTYHVRLTDIFGCYRDDSVIVDVKLKTVIDAGPDTSICKTEGFRLRTIGDALHYTWTPATYLNSDTAKNPLAAPLQTTTYQVIGNIGTCSDTSAITIVVAPYPPANAGPDAVICSGFNASLSATGGSSYTWSPATYLSDPNIANPMVNEPAADIIYTVTVTDTLGCKKAVTDAIRITVIPKLHVHAGNDTTIVEGEPLLLSGTGAGNYVWSWLPATLPGWLSATSIRTPVATPSDNIMYIVEGTDSHGCRGTDSVNILVFTVDPDMYVPTAFTPNNDGINDIIKPILLGMKSLTYFRIFNRFGEEVYETTEKDKGWNGIFKGKPQDAGTFVWMAQGVTYKGQVKTKKGFVVLIR